MCESKQQVDEIKKIEPSTIFGFDGNVDFGLLVHPDEEHILFPLGTKIAITTLKTNKQEYLSGHTNNISCLELPPSGKTLASGQVNHMGFRAYVILWDWETKKEIARHDLHKVRVQSICFDAEEKFLVSVGGQDDGTVIVYDLETRSPVCRAAASKSTSGNPFQICRMNNTPAMFLAGGDRHLRLWRIHKEQKKLEVVDVNVGKLQRRYTGMRISSNDEHVYLGTHTGDVVKIRLTCGRAISPTKEEPNGVLEGAFARHLPKKPKGKDCEKYINGVRDLLIIDEKHLLLGAGNGVVELVQQRNVCFKDYGSPTWPNFKPIKTTKVNGAVTSITKYKDDKFLIGTDCSEIYLLNITNFDLKLLKTCHKTTVYDIVFPRNFSLAFASSSYETIRIWSTRRMQELLRIVVYNFSCASTVFSHDGSTIISGWNDGIIRAFTPMTGRLIYAIPNAHNKGCSAITISQNGKIVVSGGVEGQVRVWKIETLRQSLVGVLKEHSAPIATVDFNKFDTEVVSASNDGSCVIWDISRLTRKHVLYANTQFMCARYYPTGVQILACGSDRRISYWETFDGSCVRELEGSTEATVNMISMNITGEYFVSVSNDQLVKLWDYQKGTILCCGAVHASAVVSCRFSPDGKFFVTGSTDGAILIWNVPKEYWPKLDADPLTSLLKKTTNKSESKENIGTKKTNGKTENIEGLETSRSNKDTLCTECPKVDCKITPAINENCKD